MDEAFAEYWLAGNPMAAPAPRDTATVRLFHSMAQMFEVNVQQAMEWTVATGRGPKDVSEARENGAFDLSGLLVR